MDEGDFMPQVPDRHNRRSIRPKKYDYAQPGAYFFTTCTQTRTGLFGEIVEYQMKLNSAGEMVNKVWHEVPAHYAGVEIDVFVVMPNHVHGIIILLENSHRFKTMTTKRYVDTLKKMDWLPFPKRL